MAVILYGAPVRQEIKKDLLSKVKRLGRKPVLAIVTVGDRIDTAAYLKHKIKFGAEIGAKVLISKFEENTYEERIKTEIQGLSADPMVDGVIIQLPLPKHIDSEKMINMVPKKKDADGLATSTPTPLLVKERGEENYILVTPATARGVIALFDFYGVEIKNKKVAVIGKSKLAGGPIAEALKGRGAEVQVFHKASDVEEMKRICRESDILISATGQAGLITKEFVNEKQVVVDVGINRTPPPCPLPKREGEPGKLKLVGDVNFAEVEPLVAAITPVPGGIGLLTVACLFQNLLDLIESSSS